MRTAIAGIAALRPAAEAALAFAAAMG